MGTTTNDPALAAQGVHPAVSASTRKIALVTVALGVVMDLLDTSIVNVALPSLQQQLGASAVAIQWLVAGYALSFAAVLITGGRLGDVLGYRRIFLAGTTGFVVASLAAGLAPTTGILVTARLVQGAMAALMVPQTTSLVQLLYRGEQRSKVIGLLGAMAGLAAAVGPMVGGVLLRVELDGSQWRLIFLINLPVGLLAIAAGLRALLGGRSPRTPSLDWVGAILAAAALGAVVAGVTLGADRHWPRWCLGLSATGVALSALFWRWETRRHRAGKDGIVVPALFRERTFVVGLVLTVVVEAVFVGLLLTLTITMQESLRYSALVAGLTTLPMIAGMVVGVAVLAETLLPRTGRYIVVIGAGLLAAGMVATSAVMTHAGRADWAWQFLPAVFLVGTGLGLLMGPLFAITLQDVHRDNAGSASGIVKSVEQLGAVAGVAALGSIFFAKVLTDGYVEAFRRAIWMGVALLVLLALISAGLPKRLRSEEELDVSD